MNSVKIKIQAGAAHPSEFFEFDFYGGEWFVHLTGGIPVKGPHLSDLLNNPNLPGAVRANLRDLLLAAELWEIK